MFLFAFNLSAQFQLGSVPNNELDSIKLDNEVRVDRPRQDGGGDVGKCPLYVINGIFVSGKEGNPLRYLSPNEVESLRVIHFVDDEKYEGVVFIKTKEGIKLRKNIRKMMKGAGNAEYVIFDEGK